ncbi:MAG TPA: TonB-dependent receptor [Flavisolibacter sp.]
MKPKWSAARYIAFLSCCIAVQDVAGQDTLTQKEMDEVMIYSSKFAEKRRHLVQKIDVISAQQISSANAASTGDLLQQTGNVFVQKSQQGGSSPVIRGFEASRVLLVVDGVRMNNAVYRAGHLQNVITVDQNMLERVEVLYGPASTLYGSDALGGVVHFRTRSPRLSFSEKPVLNGSAFARFASAATERTFHADANVGGKKFAWLQSWNYSVFDDMKTGSRDHDDYPGFGKRPFYVTTVSGVDTVLRNDDDRLQKFSGYSQWDILQKFLYRPSSRVSHFLNLQLSNSSDIPRYDRLQDTLNGSLRFASWYYGPQLRKMAAYELQLDSFGFFNQVKVIASYQHTRESRHQRPYRGYDRLDNRIEKIYVGALTIDGRRLWKLHELTIGADLQLNDVVSKAHRENIRTGTVTPLDTRYPNGVNHMNYYGAYAQHLKKSRNGKWILNDGIRVQAITMRSTIADNSFFNFPFTEITQQHFALTGNAGLIYMPSVQWRWAAGLATGFRAPNIDDMSRIFESSTALRQLVVPNPDIRPEYTYNGDVSVSWQHPGKMKIDLTAFYTAFDNAIVLAPYRLNGQDSLDYNGVMSRVYANQNARSAFIYGIDFSASITLSSSLGFTGNFHYTRGRVRSGGRDQPLDHIPPVHGRAAVKYTGERLDAECYLLYNGWKRIADYGGGEDNPQYATADGMPAWYTGNITASYRLHPRLILQAAVENILDRNYRTFASGFSAPGRNFIAAVRLIL